MGLSLEIVSQIVLCESAGYPVHPRYLCRSVFDERVVATNGGGGGRGGI